MIPRHILCLLLAGSLAVQAQNRAPVEPKSLPAPDQVPEPVKPVMEKTGENTYRIGKVTFNQSTREIRFPAKINMDEGLLEFLLVHENGKTHESLLTTDISATHLNLVITLLRYKASRELYALPNETGGLSGSFPDVPAEIKAASRLKIELEHTQDGVTKRCPVNDWIQHAEHAATMPAGTWVYGGAEIFEGTFVPESTGDIIAIFVARSAMINYLGDDNLNDEVWIPFPKRVPAPGTEVTVILSPDQPAKKTSPPAIPSPKPGKSKPSKKSIRPNK